MSVLFIDSFSTWLTSPISTPISNIFIGSPKPGLSPSGIELFDILNNATTADNNENTTNAKVDSKTANDEQCIKIIELLGGKENIVDVDACMTRLRVTVKDSSVVGDEKAWKACGALGLVLKDKGVQAIYGPKADVLKSNIQDILGV